MAKRKGEIWHIGLSDENLPYLARANEEGLRRRGRFCRLVESRLARGDEPAREDVAAALREAGNTGIQLSPAILTYIERAFVLATKPLRPGRKNRKRSTFEELTVVAVYREELERAREALEGDSRQPEDVAGTAKVRTADRLNLGGNTPAAKKKAVERILKDCPWRPG